VPPNQPKNPANMAVSLAAIQDRLQTCMAEHAPRTKVHPALQHLPALTNRNAHRITSMKELHKFSPETCDTTLFEPPPTSAPARGRRCEELPTPDRCIGGRSVESLCRHRSHGPLPASAMSWPHFLRAVDVSRRSRSASDRVTSRAPGLGEVRHRHPAMTRLNISPVHGRHCICERCARQTHKHD
jgi:hypothetical protein